MLSYSWRTDLSSWGYMQAGIKKVGSGLKLIIRKGYQSFSDILL